MKKSTSIHALSADTRLNIFNKVRWLLLNIVNNRVTRNKTDQSIKERNFVSPDLTAGWSDFRQGVSPARRLSDLFWQESLKEFEQELGGKITALEIGCGTGCYGEYMNKVLDDRVDYRGLDINANPDWKSFEGKSNYRFIKADSADVRDYLTDENFIFTQSALEHFDEDMTFFRQVSEYANRTDKPMIQVHVLPSAACIGTFVWHGIRQYGLGSISEATKLIENADEKILYKLGSARCNKLHRKWITLPGFLRKENPREADIKGYEKLLFEAIEGDMTSPADEACFYALVIKSNMPKK